MLKNSTIYLIALLLIVLFVVPTLSLLLGYFVGWTIDIFAGDYANRLLNKLGINLNIKEFCSFVALVSFFFFGRNSKR